MGERDRKEEHVVVVLWDEDLVLRVRRYASTFGLRFSSLGRTTQLLLALTAVIVIVEVLRGPHKVLSAAIAIAVVLLLAGGYALVHWKVARSWEPLLERVRTEGPLEVTYRFTSDAVALRTGEQVADRSWGQFTGLRRRTDLWLLYSEGALVVVPAAQVTAELADLIVSACRTAGVPSD